MIDWDAEWRSAVERSPLKVTVKNDTKWMEFWNRDAEYYLEEVKSEAVLYVMVVERLLKEGWLEETDDVLDIGSGPGTYAILMSPHVNSVTALDEAEGMLAVLREECSRKGIINIKTVNRKWENFQRTEDYSLAYAALSPAIRSGGDLLVMEQMTRSKCCYIAACPSDWMALRNSLWEKIFGEFAYGDSNSVRYPLNYLMDNRRGPELFRVTAETELKAPADKVIRHYLSYFSIFTDLTPEKTQIIKEHILSQSQDGHFSSHAKKCLNILCWRKP